MAKPARPTAAEIDKLFETLDELRRLRVPDAPAVPRSKPGLTEALNQELLALRKKELKPRAAKAITDVADQINAAFAKLGPMGMAEYQLGFLK
jgi:hypothetical protein